MRRYVQQIPNKKEKMVVVTGATGLVGSHLLLYFLQQQEKIKAVYRSEESVERTERFLCQCGIEATVIKQLISWEEADICNPEEVFQALKGCSKVIHCAALVSFSPKDEIPLYRINVQGTRNVVNASLELGISDFVHLSSTAAIGSTKNNEAKTELHKWKKEEKNSVYSITKHLAELEVYRGMEEGLSILVLNPGIIIGPGKWNEGSAELFRKIDRGLKFFTKGTNGYVDVRDVAKAAVSLPTVPDEENRFLLVAENLSYQTVFEGIAKALGKAAPNLEVKPWMVELAWRIDKFISVLLFKKTMVTKETARTSMKKVRYSSQKIKSHHHFTFTPIKEAIVRTGSFYQKDFA